MRILFEAAGESAAGAGKLKFFVPKVVQTVLASILLTACTSHEVLPPISSTYPFDQTRQVTNRVVVPIPVSVSLTARAERSKSKNETDESIAYSPGRLNLEWEQTETVVGDSALSQYWILPESARNQTEEALMENISEVGRQACPNGFEVSDSRYFYGSEATLRFMDISTPALRVIFRCKSNRLDSIDSDVSAILQAASKFEDHPYFDASSYVFSCSAEAVNATIRQYMENKSATIVDESTEDGIWTISAEYSRRVFGKTVPEQIVLRTRPVDQDTKLTLMLLRYRNAEHKRGVSGAGTAKPGFDWGLVPVSRDSAFAASQKYAVKMKAKSCER